MSSKSGPRPGPGGSVGGSIAIDQAKFPSLPTQKALLLIDFQNDFLTKDGAVPVGFADDALVERAAKLAAGFRDVGVVIWVQSQFERPRRFIEGQQIVTSGSKDAASGARDDKAPLDPEAFLSSKEPKCVERGTPGWQLATPLKKIVDPSKDVLLMKTHYSAFQATKLIQMLRSKLVTSLYICGSLINVGVHATAVDAAAHGYSITLVRDCCGWSDQARADAAVVNLTYVSGCAVVKAGTVVPAVGPEEEGDGKKKVVKEAAIEKIEADDSVDPAEAADELEEGGLDVLRELKKKYARKRVMAPRTQSTRASAEGSSEKAGDKKAGDKALREARVPSRPRAERQTKDQKSADKTKELQEGMDKLSLSSDKKKAAAREDRSVEKPADKTKELEEGIDKLSLSSDGKKSAEDSGKAGDKAPREVRAPSKPRTEGQSRDQKSAEKSKGLEEGMEKPSLSSNSMKSAPRGDCSVADPGLKPSRGGAAESSAVGTKTSAQGSKCDNAGEGSGNDSKGQLKQEKVKSAPLGTSDPIPLDDKVPKAKETQETPKPAPKSVPENMGAQTTPAPTAPATATAESIPADNSSPKESEPLCEGDSKVIYDVLPPSLEADVFTKLKDEVDWQRMSHLGGEVPRLVAVQGTIGPDGAHPVYRHPADESPPLLQFSPTVQELRKAVEKHLGHEVNHVLIQFYRDGKDYISEHSDKTLDIVPGSYIANLSLGAERTMVFRTKRPEKEPAYATSAPTEATTEAKKGGTPTTRETQRARLPHNSLMRMGLKTNATWLHAIRQDKRLDSEKTPGELSFNGARISLTFRQIGTFLDEKEELIWGQGSKGKEEKDRGKVVNGDESEGERMVRAFGVENRMGKNFEWDKWYGEGFDVLHMRR